MEGLIGLLVFAALFYLMMRFGCGAHMVHGHGGAHGGHGAEQNGRDPVCGMQVAADSGYTKMHRGARLRFCSKNCLDKFEADPGKYAPARAQGGSHEK